MATFKDSAGREFSLRLTIAEQRRILQESGVNLLTLFEDWPQKIVEFGRLDNAEKFIDTLWAWVRPQAETLQMTAIDFAAAIDGDTYAAACAAVGDALVDFFPNQDARRAVRRMIHLAKEMTAIQEKMLDRRIEQISLEFQLSDSSAISGNTPELSDSPKTNLDSSPLES